MCCVCNALDASAPPCPYMPCIPTPGMCHVPVLTHVMNPASEPNIYSTCSFSVVSFLCVLHSPPPPCFSSLSPLLIILSVVPPLLSLAANQQLSQEGSCIGHGGWSGPWLISGWHISAEGEGKRGSCVCTLLTSPSYRTAVQEEGPGRGRRWKEYWKWREEEEEGRWSHTQYSWEGEGCAEPTLNTGLIAD